MSTSTLLTVKQFSEKHPAFPEGGLRHLIFNEDHNGFKGCFPKVGRKRLIDEERFIIMAKEGRAAA